MNNKGEIFFDSTRETRPLYGQSKFLLKRWKKYSIYANSGSYSRTDNPRNHLYSTSSVYLYDYVVVSTAGFNLIVASGSAAAAGEEYFEVVGGYPRNHHIHKRDLFSLYKLTTYGKENGEITSGSYRRCQQIITSTIGENGLEDGSSPVQTTQVSNLNLIQSDNVINQ